MWYSLRVQQEVEGKAVKTAVLILFVFLTVILGLLARIARGIFCLTLRLKKQLELVAYI